MPRDSLAVGHWQCLYAGSSSLPAMVIFINSALPSVRDDVIAHNGDIIPAPVRNKRKQVGILRGGTRTLRLDC